jgi:hypothetical protein
MTDQIIPFGKYRGRQLEEVVATDPKYLEWLQAQDWFRVKFVELHQTIINASPAEPSETPEHNRLQVLFLDDGFCLRFVTAALLRSDRLEEKKQELVMILREDPVKPARAEVRKIEEHLEMLTDDIGRFEKRLEEIIANISGPSEHRYYKEADRERYTRDLSKMRQQKLDREQALQEKQAALEAALASFKAPEISFGCEKWFERANVDVILRPTWKGGGSSIHILEGLDVESSRDPMRDAIGIEIKPTVGDDYPAVLRQMRKNGSLVLFLETYTGSGATREQFIQTFRLSRLRVIFKDEVLGEPV